MSEAFAARLPSDYVNGRNEPSCSGNIFKPVNEEESGVHGILWERVLDQLGPSWSKVLFQEGKAQQNDDQLGQVGPTWPCWDQLGPSWSRTPCPTVLRVLLKEISEPFVRERRKLNGGY